MLELLNDVLAHLDVIVSSVLDPPSHAADAMRSSFATASVNAPIPYVKPVVSERGTSISIW